MKDNVDFDAAFAAMFNKDVLVQAQEMLNDETADIGNPSVVRAKEIIAYDFVLSQAAVSYGNGEARPLTPNIMASAKIIALGLMILDANRTNKVLAHVAKEVAVLSKFYAQGAGDLAPVSKAAATDIRPENDPLAEGVLIEGNAVVTTDHPLG